MMAPDEGTKWLVVVGEVRPTGMLKDAHVFIENDGPNPEAVLERYDDGSVEAGQEIFVFDLGSVEAHYKHKGSESPFNTIEPARG